MSEITKTIKSSDYAKYTAVDSGSALDCASKNAKELTCTIDFSKASDALKKLIGPITQPNRQANGAAGVKPGSDAKKLQEELEAANKKNEALQAEVTTQQARIENTTRALKDAGDLATTQKEELDEINEKLEDAEAQVGNLKKEVKTHTDPETVDELIDFLTNKVTLITVAAAGTLIGGVSYARGRSKGRASGAVEGEAKGVKQVLDATPKEPAKLRGLGTNAPVLVEPVKAELRKIANDSSQTTGARLEALRGKAMLEAREISAQKIDMENMGMWAKLKARFSGGPEARLKAIEAENAKTKAEIAKLEETQKAEIAKLELAQKVDVLKSEVATLTNDVRTAENLKTQATTARDGIAKTINDQSGYIGLRTKAEGAEKKYTDAKNKFNELDKTATAEEANASKPRATKKTKAEASKARAEAENAKAEEIKAQGEADKAKRELTAKEAELAKAEEAVKTAEAEVVAKKVELTTKEADLAKAEAELNPPAPQPAPAGSATAQTTP